MAMSEREKICVAYTGEAVSTGMMDVAELCARAFGFKQLHWRGESGFE